MKIKDLFDSNDNINWEFVNTIPEIVAMIGCKQNTDWHQEGDVYNHTKLVVQAMEEIIKKNNIQGNIIRRMLLAAALLHDIGKPVSVYWSEKENQWKTKDHGEAGSHIVRKLFYDDPDIFFREELVSMVRYHMVMHYIYRYSEKSKKKLIKLSCCHAPIQYMLWLNEADTAGAINDMETPEMRAEKFDMLNKMIDVLDIRWSRYDGYVNRLARYKDLNNLTKLDTTNNSDEFNVYIMCGIPGSGKSTYIKDNLPNVPVVSRDIMRYEMGLTSSPNNKIIASKEQEQKITKMMNDKIKEYCEAKQDFIIDNMNLRYVYRQKILEEILPYNAYITVIYVEAPDLKTCIKRRYGQIPADEYVRILKSIDFPQPFEYDEITILKQK